MGNQGRSDIAARACQQHFHSEQLPAKEIEETQRRTRKEADVYPALACRITAVVYDADLRVVHQQSLLRQLDGKREVLEIEEEAFIKTAGTTQRRTTAQHEAARNQLGA